MTLGRAKILSSENDASVSQNTNINIRIAKSTGNIPPTNFTSPVQQQTTLPKELNVPTTLTNEHIIPNSQNSNPKTAPYQERTLNQDDSLEALKSASEKNSVRNERGLTDFTTELTCLEERNRMLELLLSVYEDNPLRINNYLVCKSKTLMDLIKNLTYADKVELMVDEDSGCTGCVSNAKYMNIEKILITKNDKTTELKHSFNNIYTELIRHGISLKICI